jgi:hypothetical protein
MVINAYLYGRLRARFGDVKIRREDEESTFQDAANILAPRERPRYRKFVTRGEFYQLNCPFCGDTRGRMEINNWWGKLHPETGQRHWSAAVCYNESCLDPQTTDGEDNLEQLKDWIYNDVLSCSAVAITSAARLRPKRAAPESFKPVMPGYCISMEELPTDHPAYRYVVEDRGFDIPKLVERYSISYCVSARSRHYQKAVGRIVLPIYVQGVFVGWQARYVGPTPDKKVPKYWTCPRMSISNAIYSHDLMTNYHEVMIVEGPISAWGAGPEAGGMMGKKVLEGQRKLLLRMAPRAIYVLLDPNKAPDAQHKEHHIDVAVRVLSKDHRYVCPVFLPPDTDPAVVPRKDELRLCRQAAVKIGLDPWIGTARNRRK